MLADVITQLKTVFARAAKAAPRVTGRRRAVREALRPRTCSIVCSLATDLLVVARQPVVSRELATIGVKNSSRRLPRSHRRKKSLSTLTPTK